MSPVPIMAVIAFGFGYRSMASALRSWSACPSLRELHAELPMKTSPWHPVAAVHWAVAFIAGMVAVPAPHHTWAWPCLGPFCWHFWRTLGLIQKRVQWHVYREAGK